MMGNICSVCMPVQTIFWTHFSNAVTHRANVFIRPDIWKPASHTFRGQLYFFIALLYVYFWLEVDSTPASLKTAGNEENNNLEPSMTQQPTTTAHWPAVNWRQQMLIASGSHRDGGWGWVFGRWRTIGVLTKGVQGVQYSGFSSALGRRSRYSGLSSVRARVKVPLGEDRRNGIRITAARVGGQVRVVMFSVWCLCVHFKNEKLNKSSTSTHTFMTEPAWTTH